MDLSWPHRGADCGVPCRRVLLPQVKHKLYRVLANEDKAHIEQDYTYLLPNVLYAAGNRLENDRRQKRKKLKTTAAVGGQTRSVVCASRSVGTFFNRFPKEYISHAIKSRLASPLVSTSLEHQSEIQMLWGEVRAKTRRSFCAPR